MSNGKPTLLGRFLTAAVDSVARGLARGAESVLSDAEKALAKRRRGVESWRENEVPDVGVEAVGSADGTGPRKVACR